MTYNNERKERYIAEKIENTIIESKNLKAFFKKIAKYEQEFEKDLCEFSYYEIEKIYKDWSLTSVGSLSVMNSIYASYTRWCINQSMVPDFQNHYEEFHKKDFENLTNMVVVEKKLLSRNQILSWTEQMKNPADSFLFLAIFEGICGFGNCELFELKLTDFEENKVKLCTGRIVQVSDKLLEYAKETEKTDKYYTLGTEKPILLLQEERLLKRKPNARADSKQPSRYLDLRLKANAEYFGIESYVKKKTLLNSGKVYFAKERAKIHEVTPEVYLRDEKYSKEFMEYYQYDRKAVLNFLYINRKYLV